MMYLSQQIESTIQAIKKSPMDFNLRLSLVQSYLLQANWQQALKTIQGYLKLNPNDEQSKALLLNNIDCEIQRQRVFNNELSVQGYIGTNEAIIAFQQDLLSEYFAQADEQQMTKKFVAFVDSLDSELSITVQQAENNTVYEGLWLDSDMRTACVLELFCQGKYYWLPITDIKRLTFKPNEILTDIIWRRAEIELVNGQTTAGFVPARYVVPADTNLSEALGYARLTEWQVFQGFTTALGQKVWSNGEVDVGLLDIEQIMQAGA